MGLTHRNNSAYPREANLAIYREAQQSGLPTQVQSAQIQGRSAPLAGTYRQPEVLPESPLRQAVSGLLNTAKGLAAQAVDSEFENAYLQGARAAAAGESVETLDADLLTRSFTKAGYLDHTKSLEQTVVNSKVMADMQKLRELEPEDFAKHLTEVTKGIFSNTKGMSKAVLKQNMEQQLSTEAALFKTYTAERAKFQIETRAAQHTARASAVGAGLAAAHSTGDVDAYSTAAGATLAWAQTALSDENLPKDVRENLVATNMANLLQRDLVAPVQAGLDSGLFDVLPVEVRTDLYDKIRQSEGRTKVKDNTNYLQASGAWWARFENTGQGSYEELVDMLDNGAERGLVSATAYQNAVTRFGKNAPVAKNKPAIAQALATDDKTYLARNGVGESEAVKTYVQIMSEQSDATAAHFGLLALGSQHGYSAAFSTAGKFFDTTLNAFGTNKEASPQAVETMNTLVDSLIAIEQSGDRTAISNLMRGMSPENQGKLNAIVAGVGSGKSPAESAQAYTRRLEVLGGKTPTQRDALARKNIEEVNTAAQEIVSPGFISKYANGLISWASPEAKIKWQAAVDSDLYGKERYTADILQSALKEELEYANERDPYSSASELKRTAIQQVASRTLQIDGTPVVMPRGYTPNSFLGTENVDNSTLAKAMSDVVPDAPDGYEPVLDFRRDGMVYVDYMNKAGVQATSRKPEGIFIDPAIIRAKVQANDAEAAAKAQSVYGKGTEFKLKAVNGQPFQGFFNYNGVNPVGVEPELMKRALDSIAEYEGLDLKHRMDGDGNTIGVGVHYNSEFYPDVKPGEAITAQQAKDSFLGHAHATAKRARTKTAPALGWNTVTEPRFLFLTNFGYQAGMYWAESSKPSFVKLKNAIKEGDVETAVQALKDTNEYKAAQKSRKAFYQSKLVESMR